MQEYYRAVAQARAVLPAFASDAYYTHKASSSVAASLICGTPLLADARLLAAYSYLPANATFAQARVISGHACTRKQPCSCALQTSCKVRAARSARHAAQCAAA